MKQTEVVAAIIHDADGRIFATQRGYGDYKDWWEFSGGKMEAGETPEEALKREIWEELETRIGKTTLIREAYKDESFVYFFVARKAEGDLCEAYIEEVNEKLGILTLGSSRKFSDIFRYLMQLSETRNFTLVIDEFQDFFRVSKSVFSEMQNIWDEYEKTSKMNLVVCGSIYSLMQKILKDKKEPLYGRNTAELRLKPFRPSVLK